MRGRIGGFERIGGRSPGVGSIGPFLARLDLRVFVDGVGVEM